MLASSNDSNLNTKTAGKRWRYIQPKTSVWDARKSKTMKFKLYHYTCDAGEDQNSGDQSISNLAEIPILKKKAETLQHVLGKGLIWALYREKYPNIFIEQNIGEKRLPDVVAFQGMGQTEDLQTGEFESKKCKPCFWGESGQMSLAKAAEIASQYPDTHFCHLRWGVNMEETTRALRYKLNPILDRRTAPFEYGVLRNGADPKNFVDEDGIIRISRDDVMWETY